MSDLYSVMTSLYGRAKDHMSADELRKVGETLTEEAASIARRMDGTLQGIACLVQDDANRKSGAGSFQDGESVFALLCSIAQQFDTIAAMIDVGTEATRKANELDRKSP